MPAKAVFCGMKKLCLVWMLPLMWWLAGCHSKPTVPDVAHLPAATQILRFDNDFFAMDTTQLPAALGQLQQKYPQFLPQYLQLVLGLNPQDERALGAIKSFMQSYQSVYQSAQPVAAKALSLLEKDLKLALQLMQYYFPAFKPEQPFQIIPFIGPMDAYESFATGDYGDVRTTTGVGLALQLHLGQNDALYEAGRQSGILFDYQTRRFTPDMMVVNAMKAIIEDAFPYRSGGATLVEELVEKGKRMYILKLTLPHTPDSLQFGYTAAQLKGSEANEALIWNFFVKNDLLYSKEPLINQNYLKDGPKTPELGDGAPGYIGLFTGRRLVESFMKNHPETTPAALMQMPAKEVFEKARYKP